jgi:hypothetical protein
MDWNVFLFASKWAFIALIYFILFLLLVTVRREFGQRIHSSQPQSPSIAHLRVVQAGNHAKVRPGTHLELPSDATLGAAPDNQVVLQDPFVSGYHARIHWDGAGWWLEDLGSRNGTFVDGRRAVPYQPESVRNGANIQLGDLILQIIE